MTTNDRDALIKLAISAPRTVEAPADLVDAIFRQVQVTKQERGLVRLGRLGGFPRLTPVFVAAGLLVLAALVVIAVGSRPQRRAHLLSEYHGGPDRTGIMVGPGPRGVPVLAWDATRPGPLPFTTMPLVQDGRVYVADGSGTVAALDAATGRTLWEHSTGSPARGAPALLGDLLILGRDAGDVIALGTADGVPAWDQAVGSTPITASILEADRRIYVGNEAGTFVALDGRTGARLWTVDVGGSVTRGAALADGVVYVGATGGRFSALDATTGKDRWHVELGPGEVGTPVVGPGAVFVGRGLLAPDGPHDLVALDRADGTIRWTFPAPSGRQVFPGALANGFLYGSRTTGASTRSTRRAGRSVGRSPRRRRSSAPSVPSWATCFTSRPPIASSKRSMPPRAPISGRSTSSACRRRRPSWTARCSWGPRLDTSTRSETRPWARPRTGS